MFIATRRLTGSLSGRGLWICLVECGVEIDDGALKISVL